MPGTFENLTELLHGKAGTCYLIIHPGRAETCYDRIGLLSRLNKSHPEYFQLQVYFVEINNTSQAIRLLKKPEVRELRKHLEKAKKLENQLLELGDIIGLSE